MTTSKSNLIDTAAIDRLREDLRFEANLRGIQLQFTTTWGLFSPREIDEGSKMLLEYIQLDEDSRVVDLGCGYGALGLPLAACCPAGSVLMLDKDFVAVEYARQNARINNLDNVSAQLSNGFSQVDQRQFDVAVSNLPAKSGKELYYIMFHDVHRYLAAGGYFYIVTISGLRKFVRRAFEEIFGNYEKIKQGPRYTVARAQKQPD